MSQHDDDGYLTCECGDAFHSHTEDMAAKCTGDQPDRAAVDVAIRHLDQLRGEQSWNSRRYMLIAQLTEQDIPALLAALAAERARADETHKAWVDTLADLTREKHRAEAAEKAVTQMLIEKAMDTGRWQDRLDAAEKALGRDMRCRCGHLPGHHGENMASYCRRCSGCMEYDRAALAGKEPK